MYHCYQQLCTIRKFQIIFNGSFSHLAVFFASSESSISCYVEWCGSNSICSIEIVLRICASISFDISVDSNIYEILPAICIHCFACHYSVSVFSHQQSVLVLHIPFVPVSQQLSPFFQVVFSYHDKLSFHIVSQFTIALPLPSPPCVFISASYLSTCDVITQHIINTLIAPFRFLSIVCSF